MQVSLACILYGTMRGRPSKGDLCVKVVLITVGCASYLGGVSVVGMLLMFLREMGCRF